MNCSSTRSDASAVLETLATPLLVSLVASIAAGLCGTLMLVRRNTYAAAAISHSCFAGLGLSRFVVVALGAAWFTPTLGAFLAAAAAALFLALSGTARRGRSDAALSATWAVGMAVGLAFIAATPGYQGDVMGYLFGSISLVTAADLRTNALLCALLVAAFAVCYRGILAISFDARGARLSGASARFYETVLALMNALAVVMLVRAVGVVLVVALVSLPAMAARVCARRLVPRAAAASVFAFASLAAGLVASWYLDCQPSVPAVFCAALFAVAFRKWR